ncbi:hypothetical protein TG4357_03513 [Thalassovita gelatinovora]|uniref:Uncharacterized protein n=1 Tax=Thalassovita gelatinovora TaxID=53501 RepID=A0A0P1FJW1_THAGE|nr:hypothetical protein TG4357_03513 [Thalassovita gelatinovora]SER19434.1 hypothetical protein SAMN04488043_12027 [Thalassovita gelatinovora]
MTHGMAQWPLRENKGRNIETVIFKERWPVTEIRFNRLHRLNADVKCK